MSRRVRWQAASLGAAKRIRATDAPQLVGGCSLLLTEVSMSELKEKVKELRLKMGWVQEDLAREIGVSLSTVQRWEARGGESYPSRTSGTKETFS